jgi:hypothetical protein
MEKGKFQRANVITNELKLAFVHQPKSAGRSIADFLIQNFNRPQLLNNYEILENHFPEELCYFNLIYGHFGYQTINLPRIFRYVTVLRDPIERTISQYNHFMHMPNNFDFTKDMREKNYSFRDFITDDNPNIAYFVNVYTAFLSGVKPPEQLVYNVLFYRALQNLQFNFDFVGIVERYDDTIRLLKKKYNLKGSPKVIGKTPEKYKNDISEEDLELAKTNLQPDTVIYEVAKELFNESLAKNGLA